MSSAPRRALLRVLRRPRLHADGPEETGWRCRPAPPDPAVLGALRQALPATLPEVPEEWRRALDEKVREVLRQELRAVEAVRPPGSEAGPEQERALRRCRQELQRWERRPGRGPRDQ